MTDPRSDAIRILGELLRAQAAHIENLEKGHWVKETREAIDQKRAELQPYLTTPAVNSAYFGMPDRPKPRTIADVDADINHASELHPTHTNGHLVMDKWPPTGYCARCDALQPLWDERQALLFAATRELRAAHGDYRTSPKAEVPDGQPPVPGYQQQRFDQGGTFSPGITKVKNTTGEDEHIRPNHDAP